MAEIDDKVMAFVEETLKKSPKIKLADLFEKAKEVSASIGKLSKRQFNARYPLQVKRRKSQSARPKGKTAKATGGKRGARAKASDTGSAAPKAKGRPRKTKAASPPAKTAAPKAPKAPAKRRKPARRPAPAIPAVPAPAGNRDQVRQIFLQFATDITGAEERKHLVKVLASVDRYVDQVLKAASAS